MSRGSSIVGWCASGLAVLVLYGLITPKICGRCGPNPYLTETQSAEATLAASLHQFKLDCGRYPSTTEALSSLLQAPPEFGDCAKEPYVKSGAVRWKDGQPLDAWGNPFQYELVTENNFTLTSYGGDGQPGGKGEDADIVDNE